MYRTRLTLLATRRIQRLCRGSEADIEERPSSILSLGLASDIEAKQTGVPVLHCDRQLHRACVEGTPSQTGFIVEDKIGQVTFLSRNGGIGVSNVLHELLTGGINAKLCAFEV